MSEAVRINFDRATTFDNGDPIPSSDYVRTFATAFPVGGGTPIDLGFTSSTVEPDASRILSTLPPGDYVIRAYTIADIPGLGNVTSDPSPDAAFTVTAPPAGPTKPNPPGNVVPVQV